jgi:hypothetical protein
MKVTVYNVFFAVSFQFFFQILTECHFPGDWRRTPAAEQAQ